MSMLAPEQDCDGQERREGRSSSVRAKCELRSGPISLLGREEGCQLHVSVILEAPCVASKS